MSKSDLAEQRRLEAIRDAKTTLELLSPEPTAVGGQRCDAQTEARAIVAAEGDDVEWFHPDEVARMIATALEAKEVELAEARSGNRYAQLERLAIKRAELAEAALAEALKALEPFASVALLDQTPDAPRGMWVSVPFGWLQDARRVREGGKADG